MTANSVFNAYLDVNIILILAACLWLATRAVLKRSALRAAFSLQLQVLYGVITAVILAPVVIYLYGASMQVGLIGSGYVLSASDYALAQFLNGRFEMAPSTFESLWMARTNFVQNVISLGSPLGISVAIILSGGLILFGAQLFIDILRVRMLIRRSYLWRRQCGIEIRLTDACEIPFSTRGLWRRYIMLPSALLSESDDMRIAIAHELQHMRQRDLGWEVSLEFLRPIFFWNPAFMVFKREVEELRELACDQEVLLRRRFGIRAYCDCLLRVCRNAIEPRGLRRILVPSVPLVSSPMSRRSAKLLKFRVVSMLTQRCMPGRWVTRLLALPLLAMISIGTIATQSNDDWSQDRLMLSAIVNLERLDQRTLATKY